MTFSESLVDLWFPVRGPGVPRDHGFMLYSALCRLVPYLSEEQEWGLHTLRGKRPRAGPPVTGPCGRFGLRLPVEHVPDVLVLSGEHLPVGSSDLRIGRAIIEPLRGWASLVARLVTVRGSMDPEDFAEALAFQLDVLGITGRISLGRRREILVHGQRVTGFSVRVDGLSTTGALHLQATGLGARRRMGCGVFQRARGAGLAINQADERVDTIEP